MTSLKKLLTTSVAIGIIALSGARVSANVVTFDNFNDTNSGLFEGATLDPSNGNILSIGLVDFVANGSAPDTAIAFDTLAFTVTAPTGYRITRIDYDESGSFAPMGGTVIVNGSIVVNGEAMGFNDIRSGNATGGWFLDPSFSLDTTFAIVTITNALFALGPAATISKDTALFTVELTEVPLPASLMLMGSALVGLLLVRRRPESSTG